MTERHLRAVVALGLLLLAGVGPTVANAASSLNDGEARARLEEMERQGVLADPFWARAYWARARTAPTEQARAADLRWALRFDPDLSPARWDLAFTLLRQRDSEFAGQMAQALSRSLASFPSQQRLALWVVTIAGGVLFIGLAGLALLAIGKVLPQLHHGIRERLGFLPPEARTGAALLALILPLLVALTLPPTAALFWALLFGTVGGWVLLDRWERRTCLLALVAVLAAPAALSLWARLVEPAIPGSYLRSLWATQQTADAGAAAAVRLSAPLDADEDPGRLASLALIDRRAWRLDEAQEKLERAVELAPQEWTYLNNLGNVRLLQGDVDGALQLYNRAIALAPRAPLPRVNQAQAYVGKLQFRRADDALSEATRLGYFLPPAPMTDDPSDVIVRDHRLSADALWTRFARGDGIPGALGWERALDMTLAVALPLRPFFLCAPLFLAALWVAQARRLPRVSRCAGCGVTICRKCHYRMLRRSYCGYCYTILREVRAPLKRVGMLDQRRHNVSRWSRPIVLGLSVLLPGSGHAVHGAHRRATFFLVALALVWLIGGAGVLWPDMTATAEHAMSQERGVAIGVVWAVLSVLSLRGTLRLRKRAEGGGQPQQQTTTTRSA
jgi:tetratricopeptide (TPR) repeat protein